MNHQVVPISDLHLILTAILLLLAAGVSAVFSLGLLQPLLWGTTRCVVQLLVMGYALGWVFAVDRLELVVLLVAIMCVAASTTATRRTPHVSEFPFAIAFASMAVSTYLVTTIVCGVIIRGEPWYTARMVIPIAGMILGNAVNSQALAIDRLYAEVRARGAEVEALLALGASPWEAVRDSVKEALRSGMTPTINSLMVVGIVSIPGMMTGQILGGTDPREAARYQIVVMLMIAAAAALGSMMLVGLSFRRLFTKDGALKRTIMESPPH